MNFGLFIVGTLCLPFTIGQTHSLLSTKRGGFFSISPGNSVTGSDWHLSKIELEKAWEITKSYSEPIGVADTGIYSSHYDLQNNYNSSMSCDFFSNRSPAQDQYGHGTQVAGIIGADGSNSQGIAGVIWDSNLVSMRIDNNSDHYENANAFINAVYYATQHNIPIINFSGGFTTDDPTDSTYINSDQIDLLTEKVEEYQGLIICAAGNSGLEIGGSSGEYELYPQILTHNNIIVVGATNQYDNPCSFSNYSLTHVDLFAPGGPNDMRSTEKNGGIEPFGYTSAASPQVTGVVGLMKSVNPTLSNAMIKLLLLNSVDSVTSLYSKCVSHGRLNAYKAVLAALPTFAFGSSYNSVAQIQPGETQWFKAYGVNGSFNFRNQSSLNLSLSLYTDTEGTPVATGSSNGNGLFFSYSTSSSNTYYFKVTNNSSVAGNYKVKTVSNHFHTYDDMYLWKNNTQHYAICSCGAQRTKVHVVNSGEHTCLLCGGYAEFGILGFNEPENFEEILTDSHILPNGVIVLGPIDYNNYINGFLTIEKIYFGGLMA